MITDDLVHLEDDELEILVLDVELDEPELPELTPAEREVAQLVADGLANADIAEQRSVSLRTVGNQVHSIFQKLDVASRWDLSLLLTRRSLEARAPVATPTIFTSRKSAAPPRAEASGILNSPATVRILREAYARLGVPFDDIREQRAIVLAAGGALRREDYCALFEALSAETGRPALGLELARALPLGSIGLLEWLALSAPTLGEALRAVSEHGDLLHDGGHRVTRVEGDQLVVGYHVEGAIAPRVVTDWAFGCLHERVRALAGTDLSLVEVRLQHDDPGDGRTEDFYGCRVRFGAASNELVLPRALADVHLPTGDEQTFEVLSHVARMRTGGLADPPRPTRVSTEAYDQVLERVRALIDASPRA
jgi:DNA-binding CsgD family transcriptional regulator